MKILYNVYNLLIIVGEKLVRFYAPFNEKLSEGLRDRENLRERWLEKSKTLEEGYPNIWFHVSSVGEFEHALPVISKLSSELEKKVNIIVTFFSPSGYNFFSQNENHLKNTAIKFIEYIPIDTKDNMRFCLDLIMPELIVYTKYDVWPNLAFEARRRGINQVLISASLSENSRMLKPVVRNFFKDVYSNLTAIASVSEQDRDRFRNFLKKASTKIVAVGDTRFDRVYSRAKDTSFIPYPALKNSPRAKVVAGSTWPPDEEIVIGGFTQFKNKHNQNPLLIIIPHEPTAKRIEEIEVILSKYGLSFILYSNLKDKITLEEDTIIVDGLGFLAELYRYGQLAYVGGAFTTGVHSVLEPAVFGIPILFGPKHRNSPEAIQLAKTGAGTVVKNKDDIEMALSKYLLDNRTRESDGKKALNFLRENLGATDRCVSLIMDYLKNDGHS